MFTRLLVANRGEIALRILRACKELGVETVCVYSEADRHQRYLSLADRAICIGPGAPTESYLKSDRIIAAAEVAGADAIHPGFGFLAENAQFAEQCRDCKIEFVGPSPEAMRLLGHKAEARKQAKKAKVKTIPGSNGVMETDEDAVKVAKEVGYPVMIKAAAGGGGRGIRVARNERELKSFLKQARQESAAAFNDSALYLEKLIDRPRHVEVQVLADRHGHTIHFYERDCSTQRRYQKLVEESPSPALDSKTREELCKAAVRLAQAANYHSAVTVEFLIDQKKKFYFMEANTRIQVEHPVTEMVTGVDLIKWQIRIAAGEALTLRQRDVRQRGAAIECRINAEDPAKDFLPSPGKIEAFFPPGGLGVRLDTHVWPGYEVSPKYDSLICKLIVHRPTREEAIAAMQQALAEFEIGPIKTTIPFHRELLAHPQFIAGKVDTGFIERSWNK